MPISLRAAGAYVAGTANLTPVIPAGAVAGDLLLCRYGTKPFGDVPTMTSDWNLIGSATDGTVAAGVDVGSMQVRAWWKVHTGSEVNPVITNATNNVSAAQISAFQLSAGEAWVSLMGVGGGDSTAGTGFSVTATTRFDVTAGDMLVGFAALRSDAAAQSAIAISAPGLTVAAVTESPADLISALGGDIAMSGGHALVTAGHATGVLTYSSTLAAAHTGAAFLVRLRVLTRVPALSFVEDGGSIREIVLDTRAINRPMVFRVLTTTVNIAAGQVQTIPVITADRPLWSWALVDRYGDGVLTRKLNGPGWSLVGEDA